jgi:peptide/nickel transport system substrate-binding protein
MKKLRWPFLVVLLALVAIALLLRGQQHIIAQPAAAPVQPVSGGIYTEALIGSFGRFNPILDYYNPADRDVDRLLYSGLVRFDDHAVPQADLAESWGISQDGTVYNFSIRPNAVWHDGKPVTSDDVAFTVDLLRNESFPLPKDLREFWKQVDVKILNDKTLQFVLPEAFAPFLDYLTFGVLPKHLLEVIPPDQLANATFNSQPVGSGPFRFDHFLTENGQVQGVVLSGFKDYYGDHPFIDQVVFRYYPDANSALNAYRTGEVLGISQVTKDILPEVLKDPKMNLYTGRQPLLSLVYLNLDSTDLPFFKDANLRRALLMGLNRQGMVDNVLGSQAVIADGPILPGTWAYYDGIERLDYDPDQALNIIKDAGYTLPPDGTTRQKDGVPLSFELVYPDDPDHAALVEAIQHDWEKLGVEVKPKAVPYDEIISNYLEPRTYQAALVDLNLAHFPDPDPYPFWDQAQIAGGQNYAKWDDRQASEYLEQARVVTDLAERTKAYRNFQVRFTKEMPALPLFFPVYSYGVDEGIQGVQMGPLYDTSDRLSTINTWYLLTKRPVNTESLPTSTP